MVKLWFPLIRVARWVNDSFCYLAANPGYVFTIRIRDRAESERENIFTYMRKVAYMVPKMESICVIVGSVNVR